MIKGTLSGDNFAKHCYFPIRFEQTVKIVS